MFGKRRVNYQEVIRKSKVNKNDYLFLFDKSVSRALLFQVQRRRHTCYSRQIAKYEQIRGAWGQVAGNQASCKQRGPWANRPRASRLTGNHIFRGAKCSGSRQRKVGKGVNLQLPNVSCCSLYPHYNKISLSDERHPSCTNAMTLLIKAK